MATLAERAFGPTSIQEAWVLGTDLTDDRELSRSVKRFATRDTNSCLGMIGVRLLSGTSRPGPPPPTGVTGTKERVPDIPTVEDRIVARAVLPATTALVDPLLGNHLSGQQSQPRCGGWN